MEPVFSAFFDRQHPLVEDRQRLDRITNIMFARIQKTLFKASGGKHSRDEQLIEGSGISSEDILSEALAAVLQYPPNRLEGEWEALAVQIAHNKAVDAYRASQTGLRGTDQRDRFILISGDAEREDPDGQTKAPLLELLHDHWDGPKELEEALALRDLALEILDERERKIVFAILYEGYSRKEVGKNLGLSGQRVSQIFLDAMQRLTTDSKNPFTSEEMQEGGN